MEPDLVFPGWLGLWSLNHAWDSGLEDLKLSFWEKKQGYIFLSSGVSGRNVTFLIH